MKAGQENTLPEIGYLWYTIVKVIPLASESINLILICRIQVTLCAMDLDYVNDFIFQS